MHDYSKILAIEPHHIQTYYCRGLAYQQMGDIPRAKEDLYQAVHFFADRGDVVNQRKAENVLERLP